MLIQELRDATRDTLSNFVYNSFKITTFSQKILQCLRETRVAATNPERGFGTLSEMSHPKTQRLLGVNMSSKAFHSMGCMHDMWYVARSAGGSYTFSWADRPTVKRVDTFKYLGSTLSEDGELDAKVTHIV